MKLTEQQKQEKIDAYIADKEARGLAWDTLEFDYLRKDLDADIWDKAGNELPEDILDIRDELLASPANQAAFAHCPNCTAEGTVRLVIGVEICELYGEKFQAYGASFECTRCNQGFMPQEGDIGQQHAREMYRAKFAVPAGGKIADHFPRCPACRADVRRPCLQKETFKPGGKSVEVELLTSRCGSCGTEGPTSMQHKENLKRLAARKVHYGEYPMMEEISRFRLNNRLSIRNAARLFGVTAELFAQYEDELAYPDESTAKLMREAIQNPDVLKQLASKAGVKLRLA